MPEADDNQMQTYGDLRVRVRAEQTRRLINSLRDDKASIDSVYARSVGQTPWSDARTDGPPKLLTQQDMLVYNSVATLLLKCIDGTASSQDITDLSANIPVFLGACVQPV